MRLNLTANQRVVVDMEGKSVEDYGYPDGMTIDAEDKLWVSCFFAGKVARYDPNTGIQYIFQLFLYTLVVSTSNNLKSKPALEH